MREYKKWKTQMGLLTVTVAVICVAAAGISRRKEKQKEEDTLKVGISIYQSDDTYVNLLTKKIERQLKACEKQQGIKIHCKIVSAENDQNEQNEQVEHFAALAYDVICVNAVDRTNVSTMIDRVEESEIPLIFFNRQPVQDDLRKGQHIYYVGSDAQAVSYTHLTLPTILRV